MTNYGVSDPPSADMQSGHMEYIIVLCVCYYLVGAQVKVKFLEYPDQR